MDEIALVIPSYQSAPCLTELVRRITAVMQNLTQSYSVFFVEDGSSDNSWEVLRTLAESNKRLKLVRFTRNFGQHRAITAGLSLVEADFVIVMDCDLEDAPEEIPGLIAKAREGFDIVFTRRINKRHSLWRLVASRVWAWCASLLSDQKVDSTLGNFSVISQSTVQKFLQVGDQHRHYVQLLKWMGGKTCIVPIESQERFAGRSSYTLGKLLEHFFDGIIAQSSRLLMLSVYFGVLCAVLSVGIGIYFFVRHFFIVAPVPGWASVVCLITFLGGTLHIGIGVCGIYLRRIFDESRRRPLFFVGETVNL